MTSNLQYHLYITIYQLHFRHLEMPTDLLRRQKRQGRSCHLTSSTTIRDYLLFSNWTMLLRSVVVSVCITLLIPIYTSMRGYQKLDDEMLIWSNLFFNNINFSFYWSLKLTKWRLKFSWQFIASCKIKLWNCQFFKLISGSKIFSRTNVVMYAEEVLVLLDPQSANFKILFYPDASWS